jgi:hypothetical protein
MADDTKLEEYKLQYSYDELEEFVEYEHGILLEARETGSYVEPFRKLFSDDAESYKWTTGPGTAECLCVGKDEILRVGLGAEMAGHNDWKYPHLDYWCDPVQGIIWYRWLMEAPYARPGALEGEAQYYRSWGTGYSMMWYGGNMQVRKQEDIAEWLPLFPSHQIGIAQGTIHPKLEEQYYMRMEKIHMAQELFEDHLKELEEEWEDEQAASAGA